MIEFICAVGAAAGTFLVGRAVIAEIRRDDERLGSLDGWLPLRGRWLRYFLAAPIVLFVLGIVFYSAFACLLVCAVLVIRLAGLAG